MQKIRGLQFCSRSKICAKFLNNEAHACQHLPWQSFYRSQSQRVDEQSTAALGVAYGFTLSICLWSVFSNQSRLSFILPFLSIRMPLLALNWHLCWRMGHQAFYRVFVTGN